MRPSAMPSETSRGGSHASGLSFLILASMLVFPLFVIPLALANEPTGVAFGFLTLALLYFFPGYLLLGSFNDLPEILRMLLSPVFGIACMVTLYEISSYASVAAYFPYVAIMLAVAGAVLFTSQMKTVAT